jgi:cholesterol transport system auxiliary component
MRPSTSIPAAWRCLGWLAAATLALALGACSLSRPAPVKRTFLLDPPLPAAVAAPKPGVLRVGTFNVAGAYRDRSFVYRTGDLKFESDYYHEFFVAPGPMIAENVAKALSAAKVFSRVVPGAAAPEEGDFVLEGFVSDLYADTRQTANTAEISISFYVSRTSFPSTVVWTRDYRQRVTLKGNTPDALAEAWNAGLGMILADLVRDLAAADLGRP